MVSNVSKHHPVPTKQRLLDAATRVFAAHGFEGATTREIAQEAAVNEVTLFRLFQSKENLRIAVLQRVFDQQAEFLAAQPKRASSADLHADLLRIARSYLAALRQHITLVRALLGEMHRFGAHEKQALDSIFEPLRAEMIATLEAARRANRLRTDIDPLVVASMLPGMILSDTLKRAPESRYTPPYPAEEYLTTAVGVFLRGITARPNP